jgi:Protein of unknown function (DUF3303)
MKYMIDFTFRTTGAHDENLGNTETLLRAFSKWRPEDGLTVLAFVVNLGDTGGYVLVDANDPKAVFSFVSKFIAWVESKVVPVVEVSDSVAIGHASLAWARASSKG